jgi:hypothetical protein
MEGVMSRRTFFVFHFALPLGLLVACTAAGRKSEPGSGGAVNGGTVGESGGGEGGRTSATGGVRATGGNEGGTVSAGTFGMGGAAGSGGAAQATGGANATGGASQVSGGVSGTGGISGIGGVLSGWDAGSKDAEADGPTATGGVPATAGWVLSYFRPEQTADADSLYLAYSTDGLHWKALGSGKPAYRLSGLGTNHIRDPFLLRKADGGFFYVATDWTLSNNDANYWGNPSSKIFVADSKDLTSFANPRLLTLTSMKGPGGAAMHAWAPEAYYDPSNQQYSIIWSGNDSADRNRIYISYTKDFKTLVSPEPKVLFDPGYSVIDGTFVPWNGAGYLFFKDETAAGKDIQVARSLSESLAPGFTRWDAGYVTRGTNQGGRQNTEGPFLLRDPAKPRWLLYADFYSQGGVFGCWTSASIDADPNAWTRLAETEYSLPEGVRHANSVPVTQVELDAIVAYYMN